MPSRRATERRARGQPRSLVEQAAKSGDPRREQLARDVRAAGGVTKYARARGVPRQTVQGALALNKTSRSSVVERFVVNEPRVTFAALYYAYDGDPYQAGEDPPERGTPDEEAALAEAFLYRRADLPTLAEVERELDDLSAVTLEAQLVALDAGMPQNVYAKQSGKVKGPPKLVAWRIYLTPEAKGRELVQPPPIVRPWAPPGPATERVVHDWEAEQ